MKHVLSKDASGRIVYEGLLSSEEIASIDKILNTLKEEIPEIESELEAEYGKSVLYKYNLGKVLGSFLEKFEIEPSERRQFWNEIKEFATNEKRTRDEGKNAETRSYYAQCYRLSQFDQAIVEKLSWRQWQDLFDRVGNREDERIFDWIGQRENKIKEGEWREFEKALHLYLKGKDTSVFSDEELFEIYESLMQMGQYWLKAFAKFKKDNPSSAKVKTQAKRCKKYQTECLKIKREKRLPLDDTIFASAFEAAMK